MDGCGGAGVPGARIVAERGFDLPGVLTNVEPLTIGHINETYISSWAVPGGVHRYIHQKINHTIFANVIGLMGNIAKVTNHVRKKIAAEGKGAGETTLTLLPARNGELFYRDPEGNYWRTYEYLENTYSVSVCEGADQAWEAARTFGRFQRHLSDLPGSELVEVLPFFHHTPRRFANLEDAVQRDTVGRVKDARKEIEFAMARKGICGSIVDLLNSGGLPLRVTHNDTKLNNVLFNSTTHKGVCVVDLDTCMPGSALYDFGDLVRTAATIGAEDEPDLTKVGFDMTLYKALVDGFLSGTDGALTKQEQEMLALSGRMITFNIFLRFLTDHLLGDTYFRIHRPNHNLDRCRTQMKIVEDMERQFGGA